MDTVVGSRAKLSPQQALEELIQYCDARAYAHSILRTAMTPEIEHELDRTLKNLVKEALDYKEHFIQTLP